MNHEETTLTPGRCSFPHFWGITRVSRLRLGLHYEVEAFHHCLILFSGGAAEPVRKSHPWHKNPTQKSQVHLTVPSEIPKAFIHFTHIQIPNPRSASSRSYQEVNRRAFGAKNPRNLHP